MSKLYWKHERQARLSSRPIACLSLADKTGSCFDSSSLSTSLFVSSCHTGHSTQSSHVADALFFPSREDQIRDGPSCFTRPALPCICCSRDRYNPACIHAAESAIPQPSSSWTATYLSLPLMSYPRVLDPPSCHDLFFSFPPPLLYRLLGLDRGLFCTT
jgi:hypothetical protein